MMKLDAPCARGHQAQMKTVGRLSQQLPRTPADEDRFSPRRRLTSHVRQSVQVFLVRRVQAEPVRHADRLLIESLQIGVGNMLPSAVRVVCIDINPAVVTKLGDRGSSQTVGIVTDTGLFLHQLAETLRSSS